jgi:hypothetical protein
MRISIKGILVLAVSALHGETGSEVCATCHREIADAYRATGMARSSGKVERIEAEGSIAHAASGARYKVFRKDGGVWFDFDAGGVRGTRRLEYFIGSGTVGRSYAYSAGGFLYQAPVSWYSVPAKWDLSPGFEENDSVYLSRGIETVCLDCHASGVQAVAGTTNGYRSPAFAEGGVSCERCHGAGEAHAAGRAKMVDPAKLPPEQRDSVCAQCHLPGTARIARAKAGRPYRPGDRLADSLAVFVWSGSEDLNVTSHFERLALSACSKASGERLWCGSCHDPHRSPSASERATFYRAKCRQCHEATQCERGQDCAGCHMPKRAVRDVQHSAYTDHAIRKPGAAARASGERKLVVFGGAPAGDREYGLAYASIAGYEKQAQAYLERAPQDDAAVLANLAYLYERKGDLAKAATLYEKALEMDRGQVPAAVNLGNVYVKAGRTGEAIRLWQGALERSPGLEGVRLSLALALFRGNDAAGAEEALTKLLALNPTNAMARKLLGEVRLKR